MSLAQADKTMEAQAGFAAVDALVALLILSTTLVFSLGGLQAAARLATRSQEAIEVSALARQLLARGGDGVSADAGRSGPLRWTLQTDRLGDAAAVCVEGLEVRSLATGRRYRFTSALACG